MPIINVNNNTETNQYNLIISRIDETGTDTETRILVTDNFFNQISVINIEQGPVGEKGAQGEAGPAGQDAINFSVLPISSGGTNNTIFDSGNIVFYDGTKLSTSTYSIQDILDEASLASNAITGILAGSGLHKTQTSNTITLNSNIGEGLEIDQNNQIIVDSTIARVAELDLGEIQGQVPISKGGTNNNFFNSNKFVYFDGTKIRSFPLATGSFLFSGVSIDIVAGSGLVGGGSVNIPNGSISLNIPSSSDIFVENNLVTLTETGVAGTYSKITTDNKGRVISGTSLSVADIIAILGYTPYHPGNDGAGSSLDADLLDGQQGYYYTDASNLTGTIDVSVLPSSVEPGTYTKVAVGSNGLVTNVFYADQSDIISSLGYTPVPSTGSKFIYGDTTLQNNVTINGELQIYDHLPLLATDNPNILPDTPRGISFIYGGLFSNKTGILAYYPAENELKLVTNVFASGADIDGDGDSDYQDDINGGNAESVFVLQNLDGDASTILLRNIADNLYVKTSSDEDINGLKTFRDGLQVIRQIKITNPPGNNLPPLEIYENTNKVTNLNSDLLDGEHGTYYTEASNITGSFSYENVTFDHIEGIHKYIPIFNDTQNTPANRITSSVINQDGNDNIIINQNKSISISSGSDIQSSQNSLSVGVNTISGDNSFAVGTDNIILSNNSIALNSNSKTTANNSVAIGTYGRAYLPNQLAFGAFQRNDSETDTLLQHAQHTTITAHLESTQAGTSWVSLTPTITIPQNTTIAYDVELLISKTFGTGVAHYKFSSGLFKNATFRNANNLIEIINLTTQPRVAQKDELFNNSQLKNHYYSFRHPNSLDFQQDAHIRNNMQTNSIKLENSKDYYQFSASAKSVKGFYEKTNDGTLVLDIHRPYYSGSFATDTTNRGIKITSKNHGVTNNSYIDAKFSDISTYNLEDGYYKVYSVINNDVFFLERPAYTGFLSYYSGTTVDYAKIVINRNSIQDLSFVSGLFDISPQIYTDSSLDGVQIFSSGNIFSGYDYSNTMSLYIDNIEIAKRQTYPSGIEISITPLAINSGSIALTHQKSVSGNFISDKTVFKKIPGIYTRRQKNDGTYQLEVYTSGSEPINLPHTPLRYELVAGYGDDDNDSFEIKNINDEYFIASKNLFNYEDKNIYTIRLKAIDRSDYRFKEKIFNIIVNDKKDPYKLLSIPDQTVDISETFDYTIPSGVFNEEDYEGSLTYSAIQQNGNQLPSWLSFNSNTLNFSGIPSGCDLGIYNIRVYAENNFSKIFEDFYLRVIDNTVQSFDSESSDSLDITDIQLSKYNIDENLPSGTIFTQISGVGSYAPYMHFHTANNNFSGLLVNNKDIFEARNISMNFPLVSIYGNVGLIPNNALLTNNNLPNNSRVINVYKPFILSGTPGLTDGKIYFTNSYNDNSKLFFPDLNIYNTEDSQLPDYFTIQSFNDYSVFVGDRIALRTELNTEFPELLRDENGNVIVVKHSSFTGPLLLSTNIVWGVAYSGCNDRDLIGNQLVSFTPRTRDYNIEINTSGALDNFNIPPQSGLKRSNIKYGQDIFSFRETIENPVLAMYGIGSGDLCTILSEDNYLITTELSDDIVSDSENHHGTRIEINKSYEIFDNYRVVKDNGKLLINKFDQFISENGDPIVNDYAISARSGDVCILFPGSRQGEEKLIYPDAIDMSDNIYNYYYNLGKLIPFSFTNNKYFVKIDSIYTGVNIDTLIEYNSVEPNTQQYDIYGIQTYQYNTQSGVCPTNVLTTGIKGFESLSISDQQEYATGIVDIYTEAGTGNIILNFSQDINLDYRYTNNIKLKEVLSQDESLDLPIIQNYTDIDIIDADSVSIKNYFYLPESGIAGTGTFTANIDENHGYIEESSSIINRLPIKFENRISAQNGIDLDVTHRPKNYLFDIINISGNKITVKDDKNYLLKENGRPDYFDQAIDAKYLTNGVIFTGSLFNDHSNIYDVRYNSKNINSNTIKNIQFKYDYENKKLSFTVPSGFIKIFDEVIITFPSGFLYSEGVLSSLINKDELLPNQPLQDLEPNQDNILLESSPIIEDGKQEVVITGILPNTYSDVNGVCIVNNNIINRLESGLLINHTGINNISGHEINSIISGFDFSAAMVKNYSILSADAIDLIDENHVEHASVFATGNNLLLSGIRILREANSNDVGYSEYYLIDTNTPMLSTSTITGIGASGNQYRYFLESNSGTNTANNLYVEFLYLGHNFNTINVSGNYSISGGLDKFRIYKTSLGEEQQKIFSTGVITGTSLIQDLNIDVSVNRYDQIKIELDIAGGNYKNSFDLATHVVSDVPIKPYIFEGSGIFNTIISPGSSWSENIFSILPYIVTNNKYCGESYDKDKQIFFNGNIIEIFDFDTIKSYLIENDEIKILKFNNENLIGSGITSYINKYNATNETNIVSGISIMGKRNIAPRSDVNRIDHRVLQGEQRFNAPFGNNISTPLSNTGTIKFIKSTSGEFSLLDYNNIHYHTYGDTTAYYPLDSDGRYVHPPQTGIYTISSNTSSCTSGTLCIRISGYNISAITGMTDFADRSNIGKISNVLVGANGNKGVARPYGFDKKFYFDFDDGAPELSNIYYIEDMLAPNILTIKTPYNSNYVGKSGIVYIIDSDQNIKSHLNPNIDNTLILSSGYINGIGVDTSSFNYFDHTTKRWKHTIHIHEQPALTGHNATIFNNTSVDFLSIGQEKIKITDIQYSIDNSQTYQNIENDSITINSQTPEIIFKIRTIDGDNSLFNDRKKSTPKVSISGLGGYRIEMDEPINFGRGENYWDIGIKCTPPAETGYNRNIAIRASDLTGSDTKIININQYLQPQISPIYTGYAITGSNWFVGFDISSLDLDTKLIANEIRLDLDNVPVDGSYNISYIDDRSVVYSGAAGTTTGIYYPSLSVVDLTTSPYQTIDTTSGSIMVLDHISSKPIFDIQLNNFESVHYLNIDNQDRIMFEIPAELGPVPSEVLNNLSITFTTNPEYNIFLYSSSYNSNTKRFEIIAIPQQTGQSSYVDHTAKYTNQILGISLKQPVYDTFGNYTYQTSTKSFGFNLILYKDTIIDPIPLYNNLSFNTESAWSVDFYVLYGIRQHDPFVRPNVRIFGAPNLSSYDNNPSEYDVEYNYDDTKKAWKVSVVSNKNIFDEYVSNTGIYNLSIFAEDRYSSYSINNDINIIYYHTSRRENVDPVVYGTPDHIFFTKADSLNFNENFIDSEISFPDNLKEQSVNLNLIDKLYDRDLNIWQYGYSSEPMVDKYDTRLLLSDNSITLQCKGLGSDKIIAVGKINTIEIENNELQGLPLRITGINSYGSESGIIVAQGTSKWDLTFKTIGGLAHENYPPTIILSEMPTACSGFDPLISEQMQCAQNPTWDGDDLGGSWSYKFSGLPSCNLLGQFPFTITAIDTDTSLLPASPYVASITEHHLISYKETLFSGLPPTITEANNNQTTIKPLCNNTFYTNRLNFGPGPGQVCLGPTGIKSFGVSGSLPSGLSYSLFFPEEGNTPVAPYDNFGSGYLLIEGYVSTFASGGKYPEEMKLTVTDARGLSVERLITFNDSSTSIDPDVSIAVYFKDEKPALTPSTGLKILLGSSTPAWRPAPIEESLACKSVLPHNGCEIINVIYSGQLSADTRIFLIDLNTNDDLNILANDEIYIDFYDATNDELDGPYLVHTENDLPYIDGGITPQPPTGYARLVKGDYQNINILNYDTLFDSLNIIDNTTKCILGGGVVGFSLSENSTYRGLRGAIVPSFKTAVTGLTAFESTNTRYSGLQFTRINPSVNIVSTIGWSDCWQTGLLNISGLVVPPVSVEIVDPPPAQDYDFSFNGARFALATRLSVGVTESQKLLLANERISTLKYELIDTFTEEKIQNGSVAAGNSFDTVSLTTTTGTIYKLNILKDSDSFPTYDSSAMPGDSNDYIWIHKGNNLTDIPTQSSFPAILTFGFDSISVINDLDDGDPQGVVMEPITAIALGGYVPSDAGIGLSEPYNATGSPLSQWSSSNYLPLISGVIQSGLNKESLSNISTTYAEQSNVVIVATTGLVVGDIVDYEFYTLDGQSNKTIIDYGIITLDSSNINSNNYFTYTKELEGGSNIVGFTDIKFKSLVENINNNQMVIRHSNIPFQIGDSLCIDKNSSISTQFALLNNPGEITVVSGDNQLIYLENSNSSTDWHDGFDIGDAVSVLQNLDDNIKIMPYNTTYLSEGRYAFQITGRSNIFENIDLIYKILTAENPNMPVFDSSSYPSVNITPKQYFQNYPLYVNKPIKIATDTVDKSGNVLSFSIIGGKRPIQNHTPDVQLAAGTNDLGYCGFFRTSVGDQIKDEYDSVNDRLNIVINLSNDYGIDWSQHASLKIRVSDETGSDEYILNY